MDKAFKHDMIGAGDGSFLKTAKALQENGHATKKDHAKVLRLKSKNVF
jgi:hypothetical protein